MLALRTLYPEELLLECEPRFLKLLVPMRALVLKAEQNQQAVDIHFAVHKMGPAQDRQPK